MFFSPDIFLPIFLFTFRNPLDIFESISEEIEKKNIIENFVYHIIICYFSIFSYIKTKTILRITDQEFDLLKFKHHEYFSINQNIDFWLIGTFSRMNARQKKFEKLVFFIVYSFKVIFHFHWKPFSWLSQTKLAEPYPMNTFS